MKDIYRIADNLREADLLEVKAAGMTPYVALRMGVDHSKECYTVFNDNNEPFAKFGCSPVKGYASVWWLSTDEVKDYYREFVRESRIWLRKFTDEHEIVANHVYEENTLAIKWLQRCGAVFINKRSIGGLTHFEFIIKKGDV